MTFIKSFIIRAFFCPTKLENSSNVHSDIIMLVQNIWMILAALYRMWVCQSRRIMMTDWPLLGHFLTSSDCPRAFRRETHMLIKTLETVTDSSVNQAYGSLSCDTVKTTSWLKLVSCFEMCVVFLNYLN